MFKNYFLVILFLFSIHLIAQNDSSGLKGTIKVGKPKEKSVFIGAFAKYRYELDKKQAGIASNYTIFQPFPIEEDFGFPFNYSRYFGEKFKNEKVDLKGKLSDTVKIEVKISPNGKAYLHYKATDQDDDLKIRSLLYARQIKEWFPAYMMVPQKGNFKNQTVIAPKKINVTAVGVITVVFSSQPFEK
jgi:hypothetical protein